MVSEARRGYWGGGVPYLADNLWFVREQGGAQHVAIMGRHRLEDGVEAGVAAPAHVAKFCGVCCDDLVADWHEVPSYRSFTAAPQKDGNGH